jgi:hypothetical protein
MKLLAAIYNDLRAQVRRVNQKYGEPRIHMTPFVKVCLVSLRVYLFTLIGLMVLKFITLVK